MSAATASPLSAYIGDPSLRSIMDDVAADPQRILEHADNAQYREQLLRVLPTVIAGGAPPANADTDTITDADTERARGNDAFRRGDHIAALAHYDRALAADSSSYVCRANRAAALLALGRLSDALEAVLLAIEGAQAAGAPPAFLAKCHVRLATIARAGGHTAGARAALEAALAIRDDAAVRGMLASL